MIKRKNYISTKTYNILDNIPSWFKLQQEDSNGFPLINAIGQEQERIDEQFKENFNDLFIRTANINQISNLYYVDKNKLINKQILYASGITEDIPIYVVNKNYDFYNNYPTRVEYIKSVDLFSGLLNGLMSGISNIRYFSNYSSGYYYVINDITAINPSSILIFDDNYKLIDNLSYSSGRMDYSHYGNYEIIEPETSGNLTSKYPQYRIMTSGDPVADNVTNYWYDPHYEPQAASGWINKWYYDDDNNLKYYLTALNNPYGSGKYNLSSGTLTFKAVESSIKVYDILNLNQSGQPTPIPMSGIAVYEYISSPKDFRYIGYDEKVPQSYQGYGGETAGLLYYTSWFQGRTSGYLDDDVPPHSGTFRYIQGSGALTNAIWFNNPISKYLIEYDYSKFDYLQDIVTDSKYLNINLLPSNPIILNQSTDTYVSVPWEFAKSSISGIRVDPDYVRPGRDIQITMTLTDSHIDNWVNPSGTPYNLNLYRRNLGVTQQIADSDYIKKGYI